MTHDPALKPATPLANASRRRFPGESDDDRRTIASRANAGRFRCPVFSKGTTRSSPTTGCSARNASGPVDAMPIWTILDMTPGGRGKDWYPKLSYEEG
ncbi:hypothetical protein SRS16P3_00275 (plasmid) [Variovorax sp. SRS16]|nr:hypothetical protein SRS16P3_00275 [Variovorax sp. SRS16]